MRMGEEEEGMKAYNDQLATAEDSKDQQLMADCYHELANVMCVKERFAEAVVRFQQELELRRLLDNLESTFRCLLALGMSKESSKGTSFFHIFLTTLVTRFLLELIYLNT